MMHDTVVRALLHGGARRRRSVGRASHGSKFLCPMPGYDRHFAICEHFGIEMVDGAHGRRRAGHGSGRAARRCRRRRSRACGACPSTATRPARRTPMRVVAPGAHEDGGAGLPDLLGQRVRRARPVPRRATPRRYPGGVQPAAGHPNRPFVFGSTSKISFAGCGRSPLRAARPTSPDVETAPRVQTIGPDKVNQLRHLGFFKDEAGLMRAHERSTPRCSVPKFEAVTRIFESGARRQGHRDLDQAARRLLREPRHARRLRDGGGALADEAGVKLTGAGATFPYGKDPRDRNIRIAPSLPPLAQVEQAMQVVAACVESAGFGYDERRHVTVWGTAATSRDGQARSSAPNGLGLGRVGGPVPRVRRADRAPVARLLRPHLRRAGPPRPTAPGPRAGSRCARRACRSCRPRSSRSASASRSRRRRASSTSSPRSSRSSGRRRSISGSTSPTTSSTRGSAPTTRTSVRPSSAAARASSSTGSCRCAACRSSRCHVRRRDRLRARPARGRAFSPALLVIGIARDRAVDRLHGAAAEARLPRLGRADDRDRLRPADAARRLRRPVGRHDLHRGRRGIASRSRSSSRSSST